MRESRIAPLRELGPQARTIPDMLLDRARLGDKIFVSAGGTARTYGEMPLVAAGRAGSLAAAGVQPGDRVAVMATNRIEFLDLWFACAWSGAVLVPVNIDLRAAQLHHVLKNSGSRLLVVEAGCLEQVRRLDLASLQVQCIWVLPGESDAEPRGLEEPYPGMGTELEPFASAPEDTCAILYTSGTTGPPKGVCCPHAQSFWWGVNMSELLGITENDVLHTSLPLFHTNALNAAFHALGGGATLVVGERFSASRFWQRLVESGATVTYLLGVMVQILSDREPGEHDRRHLVRSALAPGTARDLLAPFKERFGVDLIDAYGSTETNAAIAATSGAPAGSMGRLLPGFDARVVDEHDSQVPDGTPGELVLRANEPFCFATGYYGDPAATASAWRNRWYYTGDQVVRDSDGWFTFRQRLNDRIRRRGENVSAWEVEQAIETHPAVSLAAVVGVPSDLGEDDVMAFVMPREGSAVDPAELIAHCAPLLAPFALPRFIEIVESLPVTTTGKVEKYRLRERLRGETTWDRELTARVALEAAGATATQNTATERAPVVRMTGVSKQYPGVRALNQVSLVLFPGEIHALAGENGSGKSTLAKILYGGMRPDAGRIEVDGVEASWTSPRQALEHGIVGISQELTLAPTLSVAENVLMGRLPRTPAGMIDWRAAHRAAREALAQLEVGVDTHARVADLSIELQQEIEIARALSAEPRILVLDEATSSLSEAATTRLLAKLGELRARGAAILFISHRLRELYQCADRVTVLRDGQLVGDFPLPAMPAGELVRRMVGRPLTDLYHRRPARHGDTLLSVQNLAAPAHGLWNATFDVRFGEILGIAGLVGSGKAEVGLALAGAIPGEGEVLIDGQTVRIDSPRRAQAAGIAFVPDDRKRQAMLPTRTVQHNMSIAWIDRLAVAGVIRMRSERRMARSASQRFSVRTRSLDALVTELSGGNQQKVILSRWFAADHSVIVLSEPTRGVDVGAKSEIYGFIQDLAAQGRAIVMISSELPELLGVTDRILVMFRGRVRGEFDARTATEEEVAQVALTGAAEGVAA